MVTSILACQCRRADYTERKSECKLSANSVGLILTALRLVYVSSLRPLAVWLHVS